MKVYLIRHGQTQWNYQKRIQGRKETSLNQTGLKQAALLANGMETRSISQIFCSPQKRAMETASFIAERKNLEIIPVDGLKEVSYGVWEGMTWEEVEAGYPLEYELFSQVPAKRFPPEGEILLEIQHRCACTFESIMNQSHGDIAIVSHGSTLEHLLKYLLKRPEDAPPIVLKNASITTVDISPRPYVCVLTEENDIKHLCEQLT